MRVQRFPPRFPLHVPFRAMAWAVAAIGSSPAAWAQCAGVALAPGQSAAEIVSLTGRGETRPVEAQPWSAATLAQQLAGGADVRTLALSSAALLLADRTQIRMSPGAQLRLCDAGPQRTRLELGLGRIWARTKKSPAALELQTPAAQAVVRGTDWDVEVEADGRTTLTVLSGRVDVSNAQGSVEVGPSEQATVEVGRAPVKRILVRPRERVQWVLAHTIEPGRWVEFQRVDRPSWLTEVQANIDAGQLAAARDRLLAQERAGNGDPVLALLLAEFEVLDNRLDAAERRLALAWSSGRDPRAAARRAELLAALDRGAEAGPWIAAARAQAPQSVELLLADAEWQRLEGRAEQALALLREAVRTAQGETQQAAAYLGLGRALLERGDLHAARTALQRAVQLAPRYAPILGEQATAATEALRLGQARQGFDTALALAADDYVSLAGSGLLALKEGDPTRARTQLLKALVVEPRFARAQVWLAVAEYQLGESAAALDSLARARLADPNDPLPWQIEAILANDRGAPVDAMAAAREALARLPYLKSLNPLASDSQGSANLGKSLGDFGLEHWSRAYASASYYPLWAGSHFFLADRYESDFSRKSELFQGYLSDPTVFGASEKQAPVLLSTGREWSAGLSASRDALRDALTGDIGHRGFAAAPVPMAWLVRANDVQMRPREGPPSTQYRLASPAIDLALGLRPHDSLGLFLLHNDGELRYRFPGGLDFGNGINFNRTAASRNRRTDAGASWRWSADAQTWFKLHRARQTSSLVLDDAAFGPQDYRFASDEEGVFLRHTVQWGARRGSVGWERVVRDTGSAISDPVVSSPRFNSERYDMPWIAGEWQGGPWTVVAQASWPRFSMRQSDRFVDSLSGEDLLDPSAEAAVRGRKLLPSVGLAYRFGPGRALHFAYQENLRAPGTHTLSPVATGAIPIDHQYQLPGSFARKRAVQLDWEFSPRTFGFATLSSQEIANPRMAGGRLFAQNTGALFDNIGTIGPVLLSAQTALDPYQEVPVFGRGRLQQAGFALNQVLGPRWSALGSYTWADSRNLDPGFAGNELPGFSRHTAVLGSTWRHEGRGFSLVRMVYRGARFRDEANLSPREAGWTLSLAHARESADRRWSLVLSAQGLLKGGEKPSLFVLLRYRD
ncbi:MAG: TonB-dependent receptor [Comamonadaceae bacterium]|nr:MAG: TonB-dependent receptor [Comamonadaceae bacterium]